DFAFRFGDVAHLGGLYPFGHRIAPKTVEMNCNDVAGGAALMWIKRDCFDRRYLSRATIGV
ncbi:MAG TPA: hypothetical protein VFK45_04855, partial [Gammaproteobacteria bacterium]|nr:hypothetical protein [Gammaproteobacteria bacterium]